MFGGLLTGANPYLLCAKIIGVLVVLAVLVGSGLYVRHVFNDRTRLEAANGALTAKLEMQTAATAQVTSQFNQYIQLNRDIAEAIRKVKVTSATYINSVEASAPPVVPDGGAVVLIPGGLPQAVPGLSGLPGYENRTTARTASRVAPG